METKKTEIEIYGDNKVYELNVYSVVSVSELKEGFIFGTLTDIDRISFIHPTAVINDGEHKCYFTVYDDYFEKTFKKSVPLIFEKMDGNFARELLTGHVFVLGNYDEPEDIDDICNSNIDNATFQNGFEKYKDKNVYIDVFSYNEDDDFCCDIYEVNDAFKDLYRKYTLKYKDAVVEGLNDIAAEAQKTFDEEFKLLMIESKDMATIDNMIYDAQNKVTK